MNTLIAAVAANGVIGRNGRLPWYIPHDLAHFRAVTMGHNVIVGRKTAETLPDLPGRTLLVVGSQPGQLTLDEALARGGFIAGGAQLYAAAIPRVSRMLITELEFDYSGDTYFPQWDRSEWVEVGRVHSLHCAFTEYHRKPCKPT